MKEKAIIYVRVSTEDQKKRYSPEAQQADLIAYAEKKKFEVAKVFEEKSVDFIVTLMILNHFKMSLEN